VDLLRISTTVTPLSEEVKVSNYSKKEHVLKIEVFENESWDLRSEAPREVNFEPVLKVTRELEGMGVRNSVGGDEDFH
jgi:hypothetical protein